MATLLMLLIVVGYAASVWSLWRQMHFGEPAVHDRQRFVWLNVGRRHARRGQAIAPASRKLAIRSQS